VIGVSFFENLIFILSFMKYSSTLLKKFIAIDDTAENISNNLITKTCEIEEIIEREIPSGVVIWYVEDVKKHPDADKLNICQVDCWDKWKFQIICWAKNVCIDSLVPVATIWTYLSEIDIKIDSRKMRWVDSHGMICSKSELWIHEDTDKPWIWLLKDDFYDLTKEDIWKSLVLKYPWLNSIVFDVDNKWVTHRPDLTWHFGLATELNAIYSTDVVYSSIKDEKITLRWEQKSKIIFNKILDYYKIFENTNILETLNQSNDAKVKINVDTKWLRSYILLELNNINISRSTFFTRLQLLDLELEPRNNWVDFSNLFMFLTWQPVHFFDADKVSWDIIVRNAIQWEKFIDLFDVEHTLSDTDIVITDQNKILALAWVVWWQDSWISDSTKNILVEIANFDPVAVRKTGTRLWLRTDAEIRFEKNINPIFSLYTLLFFMDFLEYYKLDLVDFQVWWLDYYISDDCKKSLSAKKQIFVDIQEMSELIFWKVVDWFESEAMLYLKWLWFKEDYDVSKWKVSVEVPFWRWPWDMNISEDIIEEVARLYGYNRIASVPMESVVKNIIKTPYVELQWNIENYLVYSGKFDQLETYPRVDNKLLDIFGVNKEDLYTLQNALHPDAPHLRNNMRENLVTYTSKNSKFFDEIRVFDIGKVWSKKRDGANKYSIKDFTRSEKYVAWQVGEKMQLGWIIYKKYIKAWSDDTMFDAKSVINNMFWEFEFDDSLLELEITKYDSYHPKKQSDLIYKWKTVGFIGSLHPLVLKSLKLSEKSSLTYFSLYFDVLKDLLVDQVDKVYSFDTLQDQIVWRDLCFVIDVDKSYKDIFDEIEKIDEIEDIDVFDIYQWDNLPKWKKSLAFKFKIAWDWNMTTEQINAVMDKVIYIWENVWAKLRN